MGHINIKPEKCLNEKVQKTEVTPIEKELLKSKR